MSALEPIDRSLEVERRLLEYENRAGANSESRVQAWRRIDALLDQRNATARHDYPARDESAPPSAQQTPTP